MSDSTRDFFDGLSSQYTAAIERCAPRYREMLWSILHYLPDELQPRRILELGCGSGNLTEVIHRRFPQAEMQLVDLSGSLLQECRQRMESKCSGNKDLFTFQQADFSQVDFPVGHFDLVASSIAIHHLTDDAKRRLFRNIFQWLTPCGWLAYGDQFSAASQQAYHKLIDAWKAEAFRLGSSQEEWDTWMQHQQEHDHHTTLTNQTDWLHEAGFDTIDVPWRYLLWTVLHARKSD